MRRSAIARSAARALRTAKRRLPRPILTCGFVLAHAAGWRYTIAGERTACPACGSRSLEQLQPLALRRRGEARPVGFVSGCRTCGVVFANPLPSAEALHEMYSPLGDWGRSRQEDAAAEKRPSGESFVRLFDRLRPAFDISHPAPGSGVLDFGCGSGELLDFLQRLGWTTWGIEPATKAAFARHHELREIPASPSFDFAVAHHVLEHVDGPLEIMRALNACLKPGGILFVSVPRLDALAQHRDYRYCINDRAHILSYTSDAMATLLGMAGFEPLDLSPPPGEGDTHTQRRLRMIGRKGGSAPRVRRPLDAARRAFAAWRAVEPAAVAPGAWWIPTRAAAAVINFERNR